MGTWAGPKVEEPRSQSGRLNDPTHSFRVDGRRGVQARSGDGVRPAGQCREMTDTGGSRPESGARAQATRDEGGGQRGMNRRKPGGEAERCAGAWRGPPRTLPPDSRTLRDTSPSRLTGQRL